MSKETPPPFSLWLRELPWLGAIAAGRFRRARKIDLDFKAIGNLPPVLVFPGIVSSDNSTSLLRRTLEANGFPVYGSKLGFVTGVTPERMARAERRLEEIAQRHVEPVVLLGWSLGGIYARVLAQRHPKKAKMVVTLGTPFSGDRHANNAWRLYNALNDHTVDEPSLPDDPSVKPPVHTVAVEALNEGVIGRGCAWGKGEERDSAHLVTARHFALGSSRRSVEEVVQIVTQELAMGQRVTEDQPRTNAVST
ncbi:esterase/lipase family protein [Qipengyuania sp. ASV99]|uniref:esterase/lipase family protein n=1 Tax=Qipengyuania sp. ASV99 TaxID=3399681 RepID=UPI003A4C6D5B